MFGRNQNYQNMTPVSNNRFVQLNSVSIKIVCRGLVEILKHFVHTPTEDQAVLDHLPYRVIRRFIYISVSYFWRRYVHIGTDNFDIFSLLRPVLLITCSATKQT